MAHRTCIPIDHCGCHCCSPSSASWRENLGANPSVEACCFPGILVQTASAAKLSTSEHAAGVTPVPKLIKAPKIVLAAGNKPKRIEEYVGRVSSGHENVSVARMVSPGGWQEPTQIPKFEEITVVLRSTARRNRHRPSRHPRRPGHHHVSRRTRPLQHSGRRLRRIHRRLPPRILPPDRPPP